MFLIQGKSEKTLSVDDSQIVIEGGGAREVINIEDLQAVRIFEPYMNFYKDRSQADKVLGRRVFFEWNKWDGEARSTADKILEFLEAKILENESAETPQSQFKGLPISFEAAWKLRYADQPLFVSPPFLRSSEEVVDIICEHAGLPSLILTKSHLYQCSYKGKDRGAFWKTHITAPLVDIIAVEIKDFSGTGRAQVKSRLRGSAAKEKSIYGNNIIAGDLGPHSMASLEDAKGFVQRANEEIARYFQAPSVQIASPSQVLSLADEILKLKGLLDAGAISQDEFDLLKGKLL